MKKTTFYAVRKKLVLIVPKLTISPLTITARNFTCSAACLYSTHQLATQSLHPNCVFNKLYAIYQTVGTVVHNKGLSRHESVIINRLRIGHTRRLTINQPVALVDIHLHSVIYCWTVSICRMSEEDTSLLPASEICLKLSTIVLLLILSKTSVFIAYYSISFYAFRSF